MLRILIVDDEPAVREAVCRALMRAGHAPVAVAGVKPCLAALQASEFDVVVTDMLMPELDGIELLQIMRDGGDWPPVLAMSGGGPYGSDSLLPMAKMLGAKATLKKPFAPAELVAAVEAMVATP